MAQTQDLAPIVGPDSPGHARSIISIQKARLKKQLLYCEFTEQSDTNTLPRNFTMQCTELAHPHLIAAFAALVPHFVSVTEQLPAQHTAQDLLQFEVSGFSVSNKGGVTLSGTRTLAGGGILNLTAPFVSFDEEQFPDYQGWQEVEADMSTVLDEVELALRGKCSEAGRQLDMFTQEEEPTTEMGETTSPTAPRKRKAGRTKLAESIDTGKAVPGYDELRQQAIDDLKAGK